VQEFFNRHSEFIRYRFWINVVHGESVDHINAYVKPQTLSCYPFILLDKKSSIAVNVARAMGILIGIAHKRI